MSQQSTRPARKSFAQQSVGDLARSIVLLLLVIGGVWAVGSVLIEEGERPVRAVDYSGQLATARSLADHRVVAPRGLDEAWVPTSADLESRGGEVHWHLGFLTPQEEYVGLEQGDLDPSALLSTYVGDLARAGTVAVAGEPWGLYRGETDTALVRRDGGVVTIVVGTASADVLVEFAGSLQ